MAVVRLSVRLSVTLCMHCGAQGRRIADESSAIVFLGRQFLLTSEFSVGCIV